MTVYQMIPFYYHEYPQGLAKFGTHYGLISRLIASLSHTQLHYNKRIIVQLIIITIIYVFNGVKIICKTQAMHVLF